MGQKLRKLTLVEDGEKFTSYGLDVFNEPVEISGETWVEIQADDDWRDHPKAYADDVEAALAVARAGNCIALWFNADEGFPYPISKGARLTPDEREWLDRQGRAHIICIVPATAARKAGLNVPDTEPVVIAPRRARGRRNPSYLVSIPIQTDADPSDVLDEAIEVGYELAARLDGYVFEDEIAVE
jgi:hypothetical protein